jgi:hypothetical protein
MSRTPGTIEMLDGAGGSGGHVASPERTELRGLMGDRAALEPNILLRRPFRSSRDPFSQHPS